jgi:hypothetical protein
MWCTETVAMLLEKGADVNAKDNNGRTADSIIITPRIQCLNFKMSETFHLSSVPSQSGYFFVSFCVYSSPNADSIILTPRIQFVL